MLRIPVCAVLFLSAALAFGRQQPQNSGQNPSSATPPATYAGDASQQERPQNQSELREALRACAALLLAATSVSCPGDASQQQAQQQQQQLPQAPQQQQLPQAPQPPATQAQAGVDAQSELREAIRACAALLAAATSVACPGETSRQQAQQPQQPPPQPPANPQDKSGVNSQIQSNLRGDLRSDPALSGTDVQTTVDDVNITLTGTVQSQAQLDRVLALTSPYAHYRNVVNKVTIK